MVRWSAGWPAGPASSACLSLCLASPFWCRCSHPCELSRKSARLLRQACDSEADIIYFVQMYQKKTTKTPWSLCLWEESTWESSLLVWKLNVALFPPFWKEGEFRSYNKDWACVCVCGCSKGCFALPRKKKLKRRSWRYLQPCC